MKPTAFFLACASLAVAGQVRRLPVAEYRDRMKAGWVGQMVGVGWGGPTEFKFKGTIIPEDRMPAWRPQMVNQFRQDDIYVEMTFLQTLEEHGLDAPIRQAGIDFANSRYPLWHANRAGRGTSALPAPRGPRSLPPESPRILPHPRRPVKASRHSGSRLLGPRQLLMGI